ncbi:GNAT family N-acetyltransferase [Erwinia sp. V71]|uniref:GNAT family N-acetyltransferase n=1 Tax=Erwinia sp. V71 TaxID=3369424 RepID=UPI003F64836D
MDISEIPAELRQNTHFRLIAPSMERTDEMQSVLNSFTALHHEFLLWSPGEHSAESVRENMAAAIDNFRHDRNEYKFLIIGNQDQRLLGCISLFIRNPRIPYYEIGYWLAADAMGSGVMSRACKMVRNIACVHFNALRLEIRVAGRNQRSQAVALKCGFSHEATLKNERLDSFGHVDDTCIFSLV